MTEVGCSSVRISFTDLMLKSYQVLAIKIRILSGIGLTEHHPVPSPTCNSSMLITDYEKAQYFNDYCISVFTNEDKSSLLSISKELDVSHSSIIIQTTPSEVLGLLSTLDVKNACGKLWP